MGDLERLSMALGLQPHHLALYRLAADFQPERIHDLGTHAGLSAFALALVAPVHTIDVDQRRFLATRDRHQTLLRELEIFDRVIPHVDNVCNWEKGGALHGRYFVFYDIHDGEYGDPSYHFIREWIPRLVDGLVVVHDIMPCDANWERPAHWKKPPSFAKAQLWDGRWFYGFGECGVFIDFLNRHYASVTPIAGTSLVCFGVKNGEPL